VPKESNLIIRVHQSAPGAAGRLFLFHHAGGNLAAYATLAQQLQGVEVVRTELAGRGSRFHEPPATSIADAAREFATALAPLCDRRFALFGHSMGAITALETARCLIDAGHVPSRVFVSGRAPPHAFTPPRRTHSRLADSELEGLLREWKATPAEVLQEPQLLALLLPILRQDLRLLEEHRDRGGQLPCPLTACAGLADEEVSLEQLLGWASSTSSGFETVLFPGGHFYFHGQEDVLAASLRRRLSADWATGEP
jgi:medium-chain acyl-[acyl-carrier-protein] hydrolase